MVGLARLSSTARDTFSRLWYGKVGDAISYAARYSRSYDAVIRLYDARASGEVSTNHERYAEPTVKTNNQLNAQIPVSQFE